MARAVALLGVVVMNYHGYLIHRGGERSDNTWGSFFDPWTGPLSTRFAAVFVLASGVGVTLMTRRSMHDPELRSAKRWILIRRGVVLYAFGVLFDQIWPGTILSYYGAMFFLAAFIFVLPSLAIAAGPPHLVPRTEGLDRTRALRRRDQRPWGEALVVVADDADVALVVGEGEDELELGAVGVLELVDEEVVEAVPPLLAKVVALAEDADGRHHEVVEVERAHAPELGLVVGIDHARDLVVLVAARLHLRGCEEGVLVERDAREDGRGVHRAVGETLAADDLLHEADAVALVEDHEAILVAERAHVLVEEADAEAVEGGEPEPLGPLAPDQGDHAIGHLGGGLVGEAHREDARRRGPELDQAADALGDDAGLAAASPREHEERPFRVLDGASLGGVELGHGVDV